MIITDSSVSLASSSTQTRTFEMQESLRAWVGNSRPDFEGDTRTQDTSSVRVSLSEAGKLALANDTASSEIQSLADIEKAVEKDPITQFIKLVIEFLTGKKISTLDTSDFSSSDTSMNTGDVSASNSASIGRAGYGIEYDYHAAYTESATLNVSGNGVIHTADGQEISFDVALQMQHHYSEETHISIREGDVTLVDPLVLNFSVQARN